jgi:outer membrane protein W
VPATPARSAATLAVMGSVRHRTITITVRASRRVSPRIAALMLAIPLTCLPAAAQENPRVFAGALFGVSTLSADGRSVTTASDARLSLYKPENGLALNVFAGVHVAEYFSIQGNWMWNRNDITLVSSFVTPRDGGFYEQVRHSHQHAIVLDGLIYFRRLDSVVRPYLGTGLSLLRFSSDAPGSATGQGLAPPDGEITSTRIGLRSHVGIDVKLSRRSKFRYSFSETISGNPISQSLSPPGQRRLANFQNLFGVVTQF